MFEKKVSLALALVAGLACAGSALAQPWEEVYGAKDQKDEGHRRVTPVTQCPDAGYVAIGTRDVGGVSKVYVVRTKDSGSTIWEQFYDVGADGWSDEGFALVELQDGSGFVTTGTSQRGNNWYVHAMKLTCDGKVRFSYWYVINTPTIGPLRVVGHDIREAFTGDGVTTNRGDLLIAGYSEVAGRADAVLLRLDAGGGMVWNRRFDSGYNERFFGLTETRPTYARTGDIAVVGVYDDGGLTQGLVARVDGLQGDFSGSPDQCMAHYGDGHGEENFQSIVEVQTWPDTGFLTMAGMSTSAGMGEDVYVVQTKPNPCGMLAQITIGNEDFDRYREFGTDIIEVLSPVDPGLGVPVGSFALTGLAETRSSVADAFLLFIKPGSLYPLAARRYGDHRGWEDFGTSLAQNNWWGPQPPGFILAGTTFTDWDGSADPMDLYLIQPTDSGKTGCEKEWFPYGAEWGWQPKEIHPHITKPFRFGEVHTSFERDDSMVRVCQ